jgi:hypothetical protein
MAQWSQDDWPVPQGDGPTVTTEPTKAVESVGRLLQARHLSDRHHVTG